MSSPIIWIIIPLLTGGFLFFLQKYRTVVLILGLFTAVNLTLAAWTMPIGDTPLTQPLSIYLNPTFSFAYFKFTIGNSDRTYLIILYGLSAFLMGGSIASQSQRRFIPLFLIVVSFIVAANSFQPGIYGVLFFIPAILLFSYALSPPGYNVSNGILKFLAFQVFGIVAILLAAGVILNDPNLFENTDSISMISLLFALGLIFFFSSFPVFTWIIKTTENHNLFLLFSFLVILLGGYGLYFIQVFDYFNQLFDTPDVVSFIGSIGTLMVITGGIWAVFERNLDRLFGYGVIVAIGYTLSSVLIGNFDVSLIIIISSFYCLAVWALGLSVLKTRMKSFETQAIQGLGRPYPISSTSIIFASLSLAGMPILACFPHYLILWTQVSSISTTISILLVSGSLGLLIGGLKMVKMFSNKESNLDINDKERVAQKLFLVIGIFCLFIFGLFPHWITQLLQVIPDL